MITLTCSCGEVFHAEAEHVGGAIRCRCGRMVEVRAPAARTPVPIEPLKSSPRPQSASGSRARPVPQGVQTVQRRRPIVVPGLIVIAVVVVLSLTLGTRKPAPRSGGTDDPAVAAAPPSCRTDLLYRPASGEELGGGQPTGRSGVRISNGSSDDAAAVLIREATGQAQRAVFIRQGESADVSGVGVGRYVLVFQFGADWQIGVGFCHQSGTSEFEKVLDVEERHTADGIEYSTFEVTLHSVPGGNATTRPVSATKFQLPP